MEGKIFSPVGEKEITRAIAREFFTQFDEYIESDVVIVGSGPSGLVCGRELAKEGLKVLILERNNFLGGGFWIGGYLMNKVTVRSPGEKLLQELDVPMKEVQEGLFVADGPHACSKLIASACDAGVKFANMTILEDVVIREGNRVAGAVINWTPILNIAKTISCLDPVALECKVLVDATGHDAVALTALEKRGLFETKGCGAMWVESSEDMIVNNTKEVYPGVVAVGMAVSTAYGIPRMGPTFGAMLVSGQKGAEVVKEVLSPLTI